MATKPKPEAPEFLTYWQDSGGIISDPLPSGNCSRWAAGLTQQLDRHGLNVSECRVVLEGERCEIRLRHADKKHVYKNSILPGDRVAIFPRRLRLTGFFDQQGDDLEFAYDDLEFAYRVGDVPPLLLKSGDTLEYFHSHGVKTNEEVSSLTDFLLQINLSFMVSRASGEWAVKVASLRGDFVTLSKAALVVYVSGRTNAVAYVFPSL